RLVAGLLWPDSNEEQALGSLRRALTDVRAALGPEGHRLRGSGNQTLWLDLENCYCDLVDALSSGDAAIDGEFLEGCADEWVITERESINTRLLATLETKASEAESEGDLSAAIRYYSHIRRLDPYRESATAGLMRSFVARGDGAAAAQAYRELKEILQRDLSREPSEATKAFAKNLRDQLKQQGGDLFERDLEPSKPVDRAIVQIRSALPKAHAKFVGREIELARVEALLRDRRWVTVVGMGGMGKTRIAMAIAERLVEDYPDGIYFLDLSGIDHPDDFAPAVKESLQLTQSDPKASMFEAIKDQKCLIIVDNCEQVSDAACTFVTDVLAECPDLHILATSRHPLGAFGEQVVRLGPLPVPVDSSDPSELDCEAVQLFLDRAQTAAPTFNLRKGQEGVLARLVQRLDGCPLAIELAASRLRVLSLEQIEAKLADRFSLLKGANPSVSRRQQTLRAVIDWSFDMLTEAERTLFRRLSIFRGAFTLAAAEALMPEQDDVWETVASLVERSLVWAIEGDAEMTYRLFETTRDYAYQLLVEADEVKSTSRLLADYLLREGDEARKLLYDIRHTHGADFLRRHADDYRSLLHHFTEEEPDYQISMQMALQCYGYWSIRGYLAEAVRWLKAVLPHVPPGSRYQAEVLNRLGFSTTILTMTEEGLTYARVSIRVAEAIGDLDFVISLRNNLGKTLESLGQFDEAEECYRTNLRESRARGNRNMEHAALHNLGVIAYWRENYEEAAESARTLIAFTKEINNGHWLGWSLGNLAGCLSRLGNFEEAQQYMDESTRVMLDDGNLYGLVQNLLSSAVLEAEKPDGDPYRAITLLAACAQARRDTGYAETTIDKKDVATVERLIEGRFDPSQRIIAWDVGHSMGLDEAIRYMLRQGPDNPLGLRVISA
nr:tetratricopeptide repeat protein [Fimbriimonadaceae bacterium]